MNREDMWTDEEIDFVKNSYKTKTTKEISELMDRSHSAVRRIVTLLNMDKKNEWTEDDVETLINFYKTDISTLEIANLMGRSKASILAKASQLKIKKYYKSDGSKRFTDKEKEFILNNYENISCAEISKEIGRAEGAVYSFIKTNCDGDVKKSDFWWTEDEVMYLEKNYKNTPMEEISIFIKKSPEAIRTKAQKLKLERFSKRGKKYIASLPLSDFQESFILENFSNMTAVEISREIKRSTTSIISYCEKNNLPIKRKRKNPKDFSEEFLLESILKESEKLGRCITSTELSKIEYLPDISIYYNKFGSFTNACLLAGILPENTGIYGHVCYSKNEDKCLSIGEKIITDYFIDNNIKYEKEVPYREFIKTKMNFIADWKIYENTMVEYFGFTGNRKNSEVVNKYIKKTRQKILFCKRNKIEIISIYPENVNLEFLDKTFKNNIS